MKLTKLSDAPAADILYVAQHMRKGDRDEIFATSWFDTPEEWCRELIRIDGSFSWVCSLERPIAMVGAVQMWPGVWSAWMVATDNFGDIGFAVTHHIRRFMIPALHERGAHRCEAVSMASHGDAHRWLEACGAVPEATLRRYGKGGEDFIVFRWDRKDVQAQGPEG